jgi:uncharacterized membrane protein HdeD (DUF308 family)
MRVALARNWWSLVIRGLAGVAFGVITFLRPGITLVTLVFLFAAYALINGVMSIVGAVRAAERHERWTSLVIEGAVGIAACAVAVLWPAITVLALVVVIGAWAIVTGGFEVAAAIRLREYISGEWLLALAGIASIVFGILILAVPTAGALVIALWIGAYAFIFGILQIVLGIRLREHRGNLWSGPTVPAPAH